MAFPKLTRRPVTTKSAPSSANRNAVALPIPDVPPVMMATFFFNRIWTSLLLEIFDLYFLLYFDSIGRRIEN
jgi:hypothetical protein